MYADSHGIFWKSIKIGSLNSLVEDNFAIYY